MLCTIVLTYQHKLTLFDYKSNSAVNIPCMYIHQSPSFWNVVSISLVKLLIDPSCACIYRTINKNKMKYCWLLWTRFIVFVFQLMVLGHSYSQNKPLHNRNLPKFHAKKILILVNLLYHLINQKFGLISFSSYHYHLSSTYSCSIEKSGSF